MAAQVKDDIVIAILECVRRMEPSFTEEMAVQVELQVRRDWGGEEAYIAKTPSTRQPTPENREKVAQQYLSDPAAPHDIARKNGMSRRTMYRWLKK